MSATRTERPARARIRVRDEAEFRRWQRLIEKAGQRQERRAATKYFVEADGA